MLKPIGSRVKYKKNYIVHLLIMEALQHDGNMMRSGWGEIGITVIWN